MQTVNARVKSSSQTFIPGASVVITFNQLTVRLEGSRLVSVLNSREFCSGVTDENGEIHTTAVSEVNLSDIGGWFLATVSKNGHTWNSPRAQFSFLVPAVGSNDTSFTFEDFDVDWHPAAALPQNDTLLVRAARDIRVNLRRAAWPWWNEATRPVNVPLGADAVLALTDFDPSLELQFDANFARNKAYKLANEERDRALGDRERYDSIDDFRRQFATGDGFGNPPQPLPLSMSDYPAGTDGFPSDSSFAWQRLAGPNPLVIEKVKELPKNDFPVLDYADDGKLRPYFENRSDLLEALDDGRLFICDYEIFTDVPQRSGDRYLPKPFALFYYAGERDKTKRDTPLRPARGSLPRLMRERRWDELVHTLDISLLMPRLGANPLSALVPVAIQIDRNHNPTTNPIFTPLDNGAAGNKWGMAKLMVQVADLNHHELKSHFAETHMAMEAFQVAMERSLDRMRHPLYALLTNHFRGMLRINHLSFRTLVAPGGGFAGNMGVDGLLANRLDESLMIVNNALSRWRFDRSFREDLDARGLLDPASSIPTYPYRDDGFDVWNAIEGFVTEYVAFYYVNDRAVQQDFEVEKWFNDLRGQGVRGLPPSLTTRLALAQFVTRIIWGCSARHAAVNFSQWDYFAFVPNMPGASYGRPIDQSTGEVITDPLKILPPTKATRDMVELMGDLSLFWYSRLGQYPVPPADNDVGAVLARFRAQLDQVEQQIRLRDMSRAQRYLYLLPSMVPNSINV